jgi:hypothetical protein
VIVKIHRRHRWQFDHIRTEFDGTGCRCHCRIFPNILHRIQPLILSRSSAIAIFCAIAIFHAVGSGICQLAVGPTLPMPAKAQGAQAMAMALGGAAAGEEGEVGLEMGLKNL